MPYTLNGIGTHYYGAANRSARVDVCQSCGRSATLSSYDTREWFCILFIPIIPLGKFRILNDCSSCRRHHRVTATDFASQVDEKTAPLRELMRRSPRDPQPYVDLVRTLIGWEMRADAERELDSAIALFPDNVELMLLAGQVAVDRADWNRALPLFERAHSLEPQNPGATYGYGWLLHQMERHDQAIPILQKSASQQGNNIGALYLLGTSLMKLSRWNEALHAHQQLLSLEPSLSADKNLLRLIRECKKHLGYELNAAERRAGRSWWPFGGKTKRPVLQDQPTLVRPSLRYAGLAIVALLAVGSVFYAWDRKTNLEMYFDNGLDRIVKIEIDGRQFDLGARSRIKEILKEGRHTVVVRDVGGKEMERLAFDLQQLSIFDAMLHDRFFLYNVAAQNVYRRATIGYAKRAEDSSYSEAIVGNERFLEQRDVDYPFGSAPNTLSVDSRTSSAIRKVTFSVADDIDLATYAVIRMDEGKFDEAKTAIARAVANSPCHIPTRQTQVDLASLSGSVEDAGTIARSWIDDCEEDLEAHRAYQDVYREAGRQSVLRGEYQKLLASSLQSAQAHYLYGRVAADPASAAAEHREAIRLDPKMIWPRVALAREYDSMGRHADSMRELLVAMDMKGHDPWVVVYYAMSAVAKGAPAEAVAKVDEVRKASPRELAPIEARWLLAAASSDWDTAAQLQNVLKSAESPQAAWWRNIKLLRLKGDPSIDQKIEEAMSSKDLRLVAIQAHIDLLLQKGRFAEAAEVIARHSKDIEPMSLAMLQVYTAGGFLVQRNTQQAARLLDDAEKTLGPDQAAQGQAVVRAILSGLRGSMKTDDVMTVTRDNNVDEHGWYVDGVRAALAGDRRRASQSFSRCMRAAAHLNFPYLEAKGMLENALVAR